MGGGENSGEKSPIVGGENAEIGGGERPLPNSANGDGFFSIAAGGGVNIS